MSKTLEIHRPAQDKAEVTCRLSLYDDNLPKPKADLPFRRYCLLKNSSKAELKVTVITLRVSSCNFKVFLT